MTQKVQDKRSGKIFVVVMSEDGATAELTEVETGKVKTIKAKSLSNYVVITETEIETTTVAEDAPELEVVIETVAEVEIEPEAEAVVQESASDISEASVENVDDDNIQKTVAQLRHERIIVECDRAIEIVADNESANRGITIARELTGAEIKIKLDAKGFAALRKVFESMKRRAARKLAKAEKRRAARKLAKAEKRSGSKERKPRVNIEDRTYINRRSGKAFRAELLTEQGMEGMVCMTNIETGETKIVARATLGVGYRAVDNASMAEAA